MFDVGLFKVQFDIDILIDYLVLLNVQGAELQLYSGWVQAKQLHRNEEGCDNDCWLPLLI